MLITPATVALAIPLYKNFRLLKENFYPVMAAILAGIVANCLVSVGIGYFSLFIKRWSSLYYRNL